MNPNEINYEQEVMNCECEMCKYYENEDLR